MSTTESNGLSQGTKTILEMVPLAAFFAAFLTKGMIWATGALLVATLLVTAIIYFKTGKLSKQQLVTAALVSFFGALTLYFQDPNFIKLKVTVINALFGVLLLGGLWFNRLFLSDLLGEAVNLPPAAWRNLTIRWAIFFFAMAALNQIVWFGFSDTVWVSFKTFGLLGLTLLFALANVPFIMRHSVDPDEKPSAGG